MVKRKRAPAPQRQGTLEVILARTFAMVRQTRLERISSLTVEVPDDTGARWAVKFTRIKRKAE